MKFYLHLDQQTIQAIRLKPLLMILVQCARAWKLWQLGLLLSKVKGHMHEVSNCFATLIDIEFMLVYACIWIIQILQCMRTGITYQGKPVIGVCFDDVTRQIPVTPAVVRDRVKGSGLGKHNISKDFLPTNSTDLTIRRGSNSRSRKCTVIWLEKLPSALKDTLMEGENILFVPASPLNLTLAFSRSVGGLE